MEAYLLKSVVCLGLFFLFYKLVLERERYHFFKRLYLIAGLILSFVIPAITFTEYVSVMAYTETPSPIKYISYLPSETGITLLSLNWLTFLLWSIYGLGVLIFGIRFFLNLYKLFYKVAQNTKLKKEEVYHVLLRAKTTPHTFFKYIFLQKEAYEEGTIPKEVIDHETTHAKEWHSAEVLLIEVLQVVLWFHPVLYFYKQSIRLNHEFLADQGALKQGANLIQYQNILLAFSSNALTPSMAHAINYSSFKKRFKVMKTPTTNPVRWIRTLFILPLIAFMMYGFSNQETVFVPSSETETVTLLQTSATRAEMKEYNALAKKYNAMKPNERIISKAELQRLEYIYRKMSSKQRADAAPFPECIPPPPPPPTAPDAPKAGDPKATDAPPPPPPPTTQDQVKTIKELGEKGASFFWGPHPIDLEEAIKMIQKNPNMIIEVDNSYPLRPIVKLQSC